MFRGAPSELPASGEASSENGRPGVHRRREPVRSQTPNCIRMCILSRAAWTCIISRRRADLPGRLSGAGRACRAPPGICRRDRRAHRSCTDRSRSRNAARVANRDDRAHGQDLSGEPAAPRQHPLAGHEGLRRPAELLRRLGRRHHAVRVERRDTLHQPHQDSGISVRRPARGLHARFAMWCGLTGNWGWRESPIRPKSSSLHAEQAMASDMSLQVAGARRRVPEESCPGIPFGAA